MKASEQARRRAEAVLKVVDELTSLVDDVVTTDDQDTTQAATARSEVRDWQTNLLAELGEVRTAVTRVTEAAEEVAHPATDAAGPANPVSKKADAARSAQRGADEALKMAETGGRHMADFRNLLSRDLEAANPAVADELRSRSRRADGPIDRLIEATEATGSEANEVSRDVTGRTKRFALWLVFALAVLYGLVYWAVVRNGPENQPGEIALAIALVIIAVGLIALYWTGGGSFGSVLKGADGRYSTSRVPSVVWTLLVLGLVSFLSLSVALAGHLGTEPYDIEAAGLTSERVVDYLVLIGGPFAAAVLGALVTATKVQSGTVQKPTALKASPGQIVQNDGGSIDLVDVQYLLFNLVAVAFVIVAFTRSRTLPEIPPVLLGLAGASAATYASNKALTRNPPSISSIQPLTVRPGEEVLITGANFQVSSGAEASDPVVYLSGVTGALPLEEGFDDRQVTVRVPTWVRPAAYELRVQSSAEVISNPTQLMVVGDKPALIGAASGDLRPGQTMKLVGWNLLPPAAKPRGQDRQVSVLIDSEQVPGEPLEIAGRPGEEQTVEVKVPEDIKPGSHTVVLRRGAVESDHASFHTT